MDWRCSCLCSGLIPSVTEKSVIFVKELSFPQTAPTDDAFFQPDWAEACWGRWAGTMAAVDWSEGSGSSGWAWTAAGLIYRLCVWIFSAKRTRKKKGLKGVRLWPLRCLNQFLSKRKDRLLRGRMFLRTFYRWGDLVFIAYVLPVGW